MKILIAENSGFCFGVKKAINKTFDIAKSRKDKKIFTYGPIIHNKQVIEQLDNKGIRSIDDLKEAKGSIVIIRSHGVPFKFYEEAKAYNIELIDVTCPFVRKVQKKAREYYKKGYQVIIIGNPSHPEVIGINGWCEDKAIIINEENEVKDLPCFDKICVVSQTTVTLEKWENITNELSNKAKEVREFNTICLATKERQEACEKLAKKVDYMFVIGGYHSSNTQKLYKIAKTYCENSKHIETYEDIDMESIEPNSIIGITAGASTPEWIINNVIKKLESRGGE